MLQYNTHHGGYGTDGRYDTNRLANWIVKMAPDVVMLNEIEKYTGWGNQNQPEVYKNLLQSKTGKTWYYHFAQEFGDWSSNGKGNLILSRVPFKFTDRHEIVHNGDRSVARGGDQLEWPDDHVHPDASRSGLALAPPDAGDGSDNVGGVRAGEQDPDRRHERLAGPDVDRAVQQVLQGFVGGCRRRTARPRRSPGNSGETKNGRIDYIFYSRNSANLSVKSSRVYDTRDSNGVMPSDHRPVLTVFGVN